MSETRPEGKKPETAGNGRGRRPMAVPSKEWCLCGHRATVHAAYRYGCQAPGPRKGFCECMRFIARSSPVGKRLRTLERSRVAPAAKAE